MRSHGRMHDFQIEVVGAKDYVRTSHITSRAKRGVPYGRGQGDT